MEDGDGNDLVPENSGAGIEPKLRRRQRKGQNGTVVGGLNMDAGRSVKSTRGDDSTDAHLLTMRDRGRNTVLANSSLDGEVVDHAGLDVMMLRTVTDQDKRDDDSSAATDDSQLYEDTKTLPSSIRMRTASVESPVSSPEPEIFDEFDDFIPHNIQANVWYRVVVVRAENLVAMDKNGLSDPIIELRFGKIRRWTEPVYKTLNPIWAEEFVLPAPIDNLDLHVDVHDNDGPAMIKSNNDYMGGCIINLDKRENNDVGNLDDHSGKQILWPSLPESARTLEDCTKIIVRLTNLRGRKKKKLQEHLKFRDGDIGSVELRIQRISGDDVILKSNKVDMTRSTRMIMCTPIHVAGLRPASHKTAKKALVKDHMLVRCVMTIGEKNSKLHAGRIESSTAQCKAYAKKGWAADIREPHEFYVKGMHRFMRLSIVDAESKLLGRCMVDTEMIMGESEVFAMPIRNDGTSGAGDGSTLTFSISKDKMYASDSDDDSDFDDGRSRMASLYRRRSSSMDMVQSVARPDRPAAKVTVTVVKARNLKAADTGMLKKASSDPFCYVELQGKRRRTKTVKGTLNPVWNQDLKFTVFDLFTPIKLLVYDEDESGRPSGNKMDFLGMAIIPLHHVQHSEDEWIALKSIDGMARAKGEIQVNIQVKVNGWEGYLTAFKYVMDNPVQDFTSKAKKFKLRHIMSAISRLQKQIKIFVSIVSVVVKVIKWEYGFVPTIICIAMVTWFCLHAALWMITVPLLVGFAVTYFTAHHSSDEKIMMYRTEYVDDDDDDDDDSDIDDGEGDAVESVGKKPGLRKRIDAVLEKARTFQKITGTVASTLERIVNITVWESPLITEFFIAVLALIGVVLFLVPHHLFILAAVLGVFYDSFRTAYNLKTVKIKTGKKSKVGQQPLPLDILERVPDSLQLRQRKRLEPRSISRMAAEAARRGQDVGGGSGAEGADDTN